MITKILSLEKSPSNNFLSKKYSNNLNNTNNLKRLDDNFDNSEKLNQSINFTGLKFIKIQKKILGDKGNKFINKITNLTEELRGSTREGFKKLKGKDKLPIVEKPLIAPDSIKTESEVAAKIAAYNIANPKKPLTTSQINSMWDKWRAEKKLYDRELADKAEVAKKEAAKKAAAAKKSSSKKYHEDNDSHSDDPFFGKNNSNNTNGSEDVNNQDYMKRPYTTKELEDMASSPENMDKYVPDGPMKNWPTGAEEELDLAHKFPSVDVEDHDLDTIFLGNNKSTNISDLSIKEAGIKNLYKVTDVIKNAANNPVVEHVLDALPLETIPVVGNIFKLGSSLEKISEGKVVEGIIDGGAKVAETAFLGPFKLAYVGIRGVIGSGRRVGGDKGTGTGFMGGMTSGAKEWNNVRDALVGFFTDEKQKVKPTTKPKKDDTYYKNLEGQRNNSIKQKEKETLSQMDAVHSKNIAAYNKEAAAAEKTKQEAIGKTIFYKDQSQVANDQFVQETNIKKEMLEKLKEAKTKTINDHKAAIEELQAKIAEAKKQNDIKMKKALTQQFEKIQKEQKAELETLALNIAKATKAAEVYEKMVNKSNSEGFKRIAGYDDYKNILLNHIGSPIAKERNGGKVKVPGGVIFFGPKGNGKTKFAEAFASQFDCELVKISPAEGFEKLKEEAKFAQKRFKNGRKRTIILMNEFEGFAPKDSSKTQKVKEFMKDCSDKYHCTLFVSSNFPDKIDESLLKGEIFYKVAIPPANKENAAAILKHYAEEYADKDLNYDNLATSITQMQPKEAFSNGKIKSAVESLTIGKNLAKKININNGNLNKVFEDIEPDISEEAMKLFNNQLKYVAKISDM